MRRFGRAPSRPSSSHSGQFPVYLSLLSTKGDFLDTLLVNRATGVPLYATITEAECTTVYAIDRSMELHRIVTINWGPGGKSSRATLTNRANETVFLSEVSANNETGFFIEKKTMVNTNYSYGQFISRWKRRESEPWFGRQRLLIKIDLHTRDSLQRIAHEDGLTDMDHVVLGALLTCTHGGRKRGKEPDGWLNEAQLQEHLRAQRQLHRTRSSETLPVYQTRPSFETLPPAYTSRVSLQIRQSTG
ncbi:hypothetical protein OPQ81_005836 [Rhizoctonia solani]|nr:hypothetical protein OPQ81_005836 [Rhizoctonia solani]